MIPKVKAAIDKLNHDGSLPPGVSVVPYYDRSSLIAITTHTVLHNLIFGCVLVFLIQWIFLGNLRSAVIVGINIPFALFFATILLVIHGRKRQPAVRGRSGFRHHRGFGRDPGREHLPELPAQPGRARGDCCSACRRVLGARPDADRGSCNARPWLDGPFAADSHQCACKWTRRFCSLHSSLSPVSCRSSPCRESRARFSVPWRALTATRWPAL